MGVKCEYAAVSHQTKEAEALGHVELGKLLSFRKKHLLKVSFSIEVGNSSFPSLPPLPPRLPSIFFSSEFVCRNCCNDQSRNQQ